jgi:cyclase
LGVGEIIVNTVYNDGMMSGYDIELLSTISQNVSIPIVACGGAGSYNDFILAVEKGFCSAVAAGSLFVFHGPRKAVLINYPKRSEITKIFNEVSL